MQKMDYITLIECIKNVSLPKCDVKEKGYSQHN